VQDGGVKVMLSRGSMLKQNYFKKNLECFSALF